MPVFRLLRLLFLSTPSARRATPRCLLSGYGFRISIHALREEGDFVSHNGQNSTIEFLSTPSARRATDRRVVDNSVHDISIHALREEGDLATHKCRQSVQYFYPRPPRGGRPTTDL